MDLHRTTGKPDWELVDPAKQTSIQKLAAKTGGILTPPNLITFLGLAIVIFGLVNLLHAHYWIALVSLAVGRLLDIVDGIVAQKTGTKSPLGELFDAGVDKVGTLLTIVAFYVAGITFWWLITLLLIPQFIIPFVSLYKKVTNKPVHPTRQGKLSMASLWVALVGFIVVKALGLTTTHPFTLFIDVIATISIVLAFYALWQYATGHDSAAK